jgi:hypothetical protein
MTKRPIEPRDRYQEGQSAEPQPDVHDTITGGVPGQQVMQTTEVKAPEPETKSVQPACGECGSTAIEISGGIRHCTKCGHAFA